MQGRHLASSCTVPQHHVRFCQHLLLEGTASCARGCLRSLAGASHAAWTHRLVTRVQQAVRRQAVRRVHRRAEGRTVCRSGWGRLQLEEAEPARPCALLWRRRGRVGRRVRTSAGLGGGLGRPRSWHAVSQGGCLASCALHAHSCPLSWDGVAAWSRPGRMAATCMQKAMDARAAILTHHGSSLPAAPLQWHRRGSPARATGAWVVHPQSVQSAARPSHLAEALQRCHRWGAWTAGTQVLSTCWAASLTSSGL